MANYNGLVATLTRNGSTASQVLGTTAVVNVTVEAAVPAKFFTHGQFAVQTLTGVSGVFGINIIGAVGGATYVIAGRTNISAVGGFPIPLLNYVGISGSVQNAGIPRPAFVSFYSAGTITGFTANVFLAGNYN